MNCQNCKEHLVEYIEDLLEGPQASAIESHLTDCPGCRAEAARMTDLRKRLLQNGQTFAETDLENAVFDQIVRSQHRKLKEIQKTNRQFNLWRIIMKSRITKFATAAAVILIAVLGITFLEESTQTAYAIEQTIQASHSVRFLHIKDFNAAEDEPKEFWVQFHNNGLVRNVRMDFPEWAGGGDGPKVIVWKQNKARVWFKKKNSFLTVADRRIADHMLKMAEELDPKLAVNHLREREERGWVKIKIEQPPDKSEPIVLTATYQPQSPTPNRRFVLLIDQATKLVTAMESYELEDGEYQYLGYMEYHDYNQPIDVEMFTLKDELPTDAMRIDQTTQEVGLPQGDLTDKEIAIEVVRQFYQALINKDYAKAGQLLGGVPAAKIQEWFEELNVIRIVSIGEPTPHPIPGVGGFQVPCKLEIEEDGTKSIYEYSPAVRPVYNQPDRWNIHGGVT